MLRESEKRLARQNTEYAQLNEDLKQINIELSSAKQKAELSDQLKSAFLANMSHEIRTPMNGIIGFSQLLLNSKTREEDRENYISIINASCQYLLTIINDIIDISKIETGVVAVEKNVFNLIHIVDKALDIFKNQADIRGISLIRNLQISPDESVILQR
ncbi:MAG: hypothetical protein HC906_10845 [Bacteroidales bacterium]|nr:hypothetical protein [Bacteroidales bacterium]